MRHVSAAALLMVFGIAACSEVVTSPEQASVQAPSFAQGGDNPPPPPVDLEAMGEVVFGAELQATSSANSLAPSAIDLNAYQFPLNVTYFFNKPGNSGWIVLPAVQNGGVDVGESAKVKYHKGEFLGDGFVLVQLPSGLLSFNLANVSQDSQFSSCTIASPEVGSSEQVSRPEGGCFNVEITNATLVNEGGTQTVSVVIRLPGPCIETGTAGHPVCPPSEH